MLKIAWAPNYAHPLPENHRFPMEKYELLPRQLLYEGLVGKENFFEPRTLPSYYITAVHCPDYWHKLHSLDLSPAEIRRTGFPLSRELVEREITIMNGTVKAALFAQQYGIAFNIAGGTHHAFTNRGEGFCLLNDLAVAARYLQRHTPVKRVLIIDLDVHQGNGTAQIFAGDPSVFTLSIHGAKNYPLQKESSSWDVPLEDGTGDAAYLQTLTEVLEVLDEKFTPDAVLYQAGVDVLATDKLGRMGLSLAGCRRRDELVLRWAHERKLPVTCAMGGGYSANITHIVEAHAATYRLAQHIFFN